MSKKNLRNSLSELLDDDLPDEVDIPDEDLDDLPSSRSVTSYDTMKNGAYAKANKVMDGLLKLYLSEEIIEEQEYIKARVALDKMSLGALIFQMETAERAIITMLDNIDSGEMHPRMFEVLGGLQKTLLDIVKSQTMYLMASEENMKKLSRDIDIYKPQFKAIAAEKQGNSGGHISARGTKELMRSIRSEIQEAEAEAVEEVKEEEKPTRNLMEYEPPYESAKIKRYDEVSGEEIEEEEDDEDFDDDNEFGL
jgi:hypothetical protein